MLAAFRPSTAFAVSASTVLLPDSGPLAQRRRSPASTSRRKRSPSSAARPRAAKYGLQSAAAAQQSRSGRLLVRHHSVFGDDNGVDLGFAESRRTARLQLEGDGRPDGTLALANMSGHRGGAVAALQRVQAALHLAEDDARSCERLRVTASSNVQLCGALAATLRSMSPADGWSGGGAGSAASAADATLRPGHDASFGLPAYGGAAPAFGGLASTFGEPTAAYRALPGATVYVPVFVVLTEPQQPPQQPAGGSGTTQLRSAREHGAGASPADDAAVGLLETDRPARSNSSSGSPRSGRGNASGRGASSPIPGEAPPFGVAAAGSTGGDGFSASGNEDSLYAETVVQTYRSHDDVYGSDRYRERDTGTDRDNGRDRGGNSGGGRRPSSGAAGSRRRGSDASAFLLPTSPPDSSGAQSAAKPAGAASGSGSARASLSHAPRQERDASKQALLGRMRGLNVGESLLSVVDSIAAQGSMVAGGSVTRSPRLGAWSTSREDSLEGRTPKDAALPSGAAAADSAAAAGATAPGGIAAGRASMRHTVSAPLLVAPAAAAARGASRRSGGPFDGSALDVVALPRSPTQQTIGLPAGSEAGVGASAKTRVDRSSSSGGGSGASILSTPINVAQSGVGAANAADSAPAAQAADTSAAPPRLTLRLPRAPHHQAGSAGVFTSGVAAAMPSPASAARDSIGGGGGGRRGRSSSRAESPVPASGANGGLTPVEAGLSIVERVRRASFARAQSIADAATAAALEAEGSVVLHGDGGRREEEEGTPLGSRSGGSWGGLVEDATSGRSEGSDDVSEGIPAAVSSASANTASSAEGSPARNAADSTAIKQTRTPPASSGNARRADRQLSAADSDGYSSADSAASVGSAASTPSHASRASRLSHASGASRASSPAPPPRLRASQVFLAADGATRAVPAPPRRESFAPAPGDAEAYTSGAATDEGNAAVASGASTTASGPRPRTAGSAVTSAGAAETSAGALTSSPPLLGRPPRPNSASACTFGAALLPSSGLFSRGPVEQRTPFSSSAGSSASGSSAGFGSPGIATPTRQQQWAASMAASVVVRSRTSAPADRLESQSARPHTADALPPARAAAGDAAGAAASATDNVAAAAQQPPQQRVRRATSFAHTQSPSSSLSSAQPAPIKRDTLSLMLQSLVASAAPSPIASGRPDAPMAASSSVDTGADAAGLSASSAAHEASGASAPPSGRSTWLPADSVRSSAALAPSARASGEAAGSRSGSPVQAPPLSAGGASKLAARLGGFDKLQSMLTFADDEDDDTDEEDDAGRSGARRRSSGAATPARQRQLRQGRDSSSVGGEFDRFAGGVDGKSGRLARPSSFALMRDRGDTVNFSAPVAADGEGGGSERQLGTAGGGAATANDSLNALTAGFDAAAASPVSPRGLSFTPRRSSPLRPVVAGGAAGTAGRGTQPGGAPVARPLPDLDAAGSVLDLAESTLTPGLVAGSGSEEDGGASAGRRGRFGASSGRELSSGRREGASTEAWGAGGAHSSPGFVRRPMESGEAPQRLTLREVGAGSVSFSNAMAPIGGGVGVSGRVVQGEDYSVDESEEAIEDLLFA